jgi:hypothetical protein
MTRYVVQLDRAEDLIVEDDPLTLHLRQGWAVFADATGIALSIPADRIRSIQRLDDNTNATNEEGD